MRQTEIEHLESCRLREEYRVAGREHFDSVFGQSRKKWTSPAPDQLAPEVRPWL